MVRKAGHECLQISTSSVPRADSTVYPFTVINRSHATCFLLTNPPTQGSFWGRRPEHTVAKLYWGAWPLENLMRLRD